MWYMINVDNLSLDLKYKIYGNVQTLKDENIKSYSLLSEGSHEKIKNNQILIPKF